MSQKEQEKEFSSPWDEVGRALYEEFASRPAFSYDPRGDALYRAEEERARRAGERAVKDVTARAASATGGYGNSFAATAAAGAYAAEQSGVSAILPELYDLAYGRYQDEGEALLSRIEVAGEMAERDYERHRDEVEDAQKAEELAAKEREAAAKAESDAAEKEEKEKSEAEIAAEKAKKALLQNELWPMGVNPDDVDVPPAEYYMGTTRVDAIAVMLKAGVPNHVVSQLIDEATWTQDKILRNAANSQPEVYGFNYYVNYLRDFVTRALKGVQ